jgi:predicted metallo-beta-lactamase superfamily hydrolase
MRIKPLAADSLGTRSMATYVETGDLKILIDPGVALGPRRYGLPPHPLELQRLEEHWETIKRYASRCDLLVVTHYHYDHHDPEEPGVYEGKEVLIKHPTSKINYSQKRRAAYFIQQLSDLPERLEYCDGREFTYGETRLRFSDPVFHGTSSKLGYVVEVSVREGEETFLFTSDVQGPSLDDQVTFIMKENPNIIFADGPMTYMLGYRYSAKSLEKSVENLEAILRQTRVERLIIDHHLLRDLDWRDRIARVFGTGKEVLTAAEFLGREPELLEARRKELYGG